MPITKQAIKKLRQDRKRATVGAIARRELRHAVSNMRKNPSKKALSSAFQKLDKAAKTALIHPNKSSRLKSRLAKLLAKKQ